MNPNGKLVSIAKLKQFDPVDALRAERGRLLEERSRLDKVQASHEIGRAHV